MVMAKRRECFMAFEHDQTRICLSTESPGIIRPGPVQAMPFCQYLGFVPYRRTYIRSYSRPYSRTYIRSYSQVAGGRADGQRVARIRRLKAPSGAGHSVPAMERRRALLELNRGRGTAFTVHQANQAKASASRNFGSTPKS